MAPNPFAPRVPTRYGAETRSVTFDTVLARFARLGATPEELDEMREVWADDDNWTATDPDLPPRSAWLETVGSMTDAEVAEAIERGRDTGEDADSTEDDSPLPDEAGTTVESILNWVGANADRAAWALQVEESDRNRVTLVAALEQLVDGAGGD